MKTYTYLILLTAGIFASSFFSCKKEVTDLSYTQYPVVEGYLFPGRPVQLKVYYQKGLSDTSSYGIPVTGLSPVVSDGTREVSLTETRTGVYTYADTGFISSSGTYSLRFDYRGTAVSASTVMPAKPGSMTVSQQTITIPEFSPGTMQEIETIKLSWDNPASDNHVVFLKFMETSKVAVNSFFTPDTLSNQEISAAKASFVDLTQMNFRYLGRYRVILARVNPEYLDMLDGSGMSSQNLTNPPTNLKNAFGIFTAMQTDTLPAPLIVTR